MEGEEGLRVLNGNKRQTNTDQEEFTRFKTTRGGFLWAFWLIQLIVIPAMFRT